jgi:hydroxypyruvate isomerase
MNYPISRRTALQTLTLGAVAAGAGVTRPAQAASVTDAPLKGRIKQSVCRWCFSKTSLEDLSAAAVKIGLQSIELLNPPEFETVKKHGLNCAIVSNPLATIGETRVGGIVRAWNRLEYHDALVAAYEERLRQTKDAGFPSLICFSGNRDGMSDEQGLKNCVIGLKRILPVAERLGVNLVMELLNSKVNHKDYMCDLSTWGVELCKRINSERFGLLYDIYHMQIMEGDVIATIRANHKYYTHYHTAGVPGRNELDENQELYYPAIVRAIIDTGYKGYLGQEFIPKGPDPLAALAHGVRVCDV